MDINLQAINEAMIRAALLSIAISIIGLIAGTWLTYVVLKAAIRDGIKESGLRTPTQQHPNAPAGYRWTLVKADEQPNDLRAD